MLEVITKVEEKILELSTYSKDKSDKHGEVFTPPALINEMLDKLPEEVWSDTTKTFFDPCAGKGNFPIQVVKRLFNGLVDEIPNEEERLRHIVENQVYMAEFQPESAQVCRVLFTFGKDFSVNLYEGDTLKMPKNYFDKGYKGEEEVVQPTLF